MSAKQPAIDVITFYDEHPINEAEILALLKADGHDLSQLSAADLWRYDQDHYGGLDAVKTLATAAGIGAHSKVLDICSGIGGPARFLASHYGCRVDGIDLNQSRVDGANRLTQRVGLAQQVHFQCANACELPFNQPAFDVLVSQEAFLHIDAKEQLLQECYRVLNCPGVLAYTDWVAGAGLTSAHRQRFAETFAAGRIVTEDEYCSLLGAAGFTQISCQSLSTSWAEILQQRLSMFRDLEAQTVQRFGQQRHDTYIANYEFFVERIGAGDLGGARFVAKH